MIENRSEKNDFDLFMINAIQTVVSYSPRVCLTLIREESVPNPRDRLPVLTEFP